jgi:hypothetical protein
MSLSWLVEHHVQPVITATRKRCSRRKPLTYIGMMAYLVTPAVLWLDPEAAVVRALHSMSAVQRVLASFGCGGSILFFAPEPEESHWFAYWVMSFTPSVFALAFAMPVIKSDMRQGRGSFRRSAFWWWLACT